MKFSMKVSADVATQVAALMEEPVRRGNNEMDYANFSLQGGGQFQISGGYHRESESVEWPTVFERVEGFSHSSKVVLQREGDEWVFSFDGKRGSLYHWRLEEFLVANSGEIYDYQTSVPGMKPWEDLDSWYRRMTGESIDQGHEPFQPYGLGGNGENEDFNRRFHAAIGELTRKGKLDGKHLKVYREVIVADIMRKYGWTIAA